MLREFWAGVTTLLRGFRQYGRTPGVMWLGLVPAAIVALLLTAAITALGLSLPGFTAWLTPFADDWAEPWTAVLRVTIGALLLGGSIVLAAVTFTALTLAVGDPFYERIWRAVEREAGGSVPEDGAGFWRSLGDAARLIALGILTSIGVGLTALIPFVGAILAPTLGVVLSGRLLAIELSSRAFEARGITGEERRAIMRPHRMRLLGFGVATQLLFMIPLGAVATMPAAVAGSTLLARHALDGAAAPSPTPVEPRG